MDAARTACRVWSTDVMPALFPYMVLSQLLKSAIRSPLATVPLAMLGGSPAGSRLIALSGFEKPQAQRLSALCATASPLFILGTLRGGFPMLLAHWLGAFVAWAFVSLLPSGKGGRTVPTGTVTPALRISLPEIIRDASLSMITVCGCMALFSVLTALLSQLLPLSPGLSAALGATLEMATGCVRIQSLRLPVHWTAALSCAAVSFGGLSIFIQNAIFLRPTGINLRTQLAARIVHGLVAFLLCLFFYRS